MPTFLRPRLLCGLLFILALPSYSFLIGQTEREMDPDSLKQQISVQEGQNQLGSVLLLLKWHNQHSHLSQPTEMQALAQFALNMESILQPIDSLQLLYDLGIAYQRKSLDSLALMSFFGAERMLGQVNLPPGEKYNQHFYRIYISIARVYLNRGSFPTALEYLEFLKESEGVGSNQYLTGNLFAYLGMVNQGLGNHQKSIAYFRESIQVFRSAGAEREISRNIKNLASTFLEAGELDSAHQLLAPLRPEEDHSIDYQLMLGEYFRKTGQLDSALHVLHVALELCQQYGDPVWSLESELELAKTFFEAKQLPEAKSLFLLAYRQATELKLYKEVAETGGDLSMLYQSVGDLDSALHYAHIKAQALEEDIRFRNQANQLANNHLMELDRQRRERMLQQEKSQTEAEQRDFWLLLIGFALLFSLTIIFLQQRYVRNKRLSNRRLSILNQELADFSKAASHDLREPLRMIHSFSQLLSRDTGSQLSPSGQQFIGHIVEGSQRMQALISGMSTYSAVESLAPQVQVVDLNQSLSAALRDLHEELDRSQARLQVSDLPTVRAHPSLMHNLFFHLIQNALTFRAQDRLLEIKISTEKRDQGWIFTIKDNGIGIPAAYHEKVFEMFQRLNSRDQYPGTGLGLPLCRKIVLQYNGRIWLKSDPGIGTELWFSLEC